MQDRYEITSVCILGPHAIVLCADHITGLFGWALGTVEDIETIPYEFSEEEDALDDAVLSLLQRTYH